jgi:hypothetical protein
MSTPSKYLEVTVNEPRKFSLVGYRIVGDSDEAGRRVIVLKKAEAQEAAAPVAPAKPAKKRVRRTKAQLAAAAARTPQQPAKMPSDETLAEARDLQKAGD